MGLFTGLGLGFGGWVGRFVVLGQVGVCFFGGGHVVSIDFHGLSLVYAVGVYFVFVSRVHSSTNIQCIYQGCARIQFSTVQRGGWACPGAGLACVVFSG